MFLSLMARPNSEKSLLEGAVLISQWGQMELEHLTSMQEVEKILDNGIKAVTIDSIMARFISLLVHKIDKIIII